MEWTIRIAYGLDLTTTIAELRREKEIVARVIASLAGCGKTLSDSEIRVVSY
jgi:hypothetical protein